MDDNASKRQEQRVCATAVGRAQSWLLSVVAACAHFSTILRLSHTGEAFENFAELALIIKSTGAGDVGEIVLVALDHCTRRVNAHLLQLLRWRLSNDFAEISLEATQAHADGFHTFADRKLL